MATQRTKSFECDYMYPRHQESKNAYSMSMTSQKNIDYVISTDRVRIFGQPISHSSVNQETQSAYVYIGHAGVMIAFRSM